MGFSLAELMVVVALIGILGGVVIQISGNEWRRERINAVAVEFAGWLETVRAASLREINNNGCTVTLNVLTGAAAGSVLASVDPLLCRVSESSFRIPGITAVADTYSSTRTAGSFAFTPRGSTNSTSDIIVNVSLDGSRPLRCVRISSTIGLIRIGTNNAVSDTNGVCNYAAF